MPEYQLSVTQQFSVEDETADKARGKLLKLIEDAKYDLEAAQVDAYRPTVIDVTGGAGADDELDVILGDAMVGDEYEDGDGYSRQGLRRVDDTDIPEKLLAWRDAAVKAALEAAAQQVRENPMWATAISHQNAAEAAEWFARLIGDAKS